MLIWGVDMLIRSGHVDSRGGSLKLSHGHVDLESGHVDSGSGYFKLGCGHVDVGSGHVD